jgi:hypothetical protein
MFYILQEQFAKAAICQFSFNQRTKRPSMPVCRATKVEVGSIFEIMRSLLNDYGDAQELLAFGGTDLMAKQQQLLARVKLRARE